MLSHVPAINESRTFTGLTIQLSPPDAQPSRHNQVASNLVATDGQTNAQWRSLISIAIMKVSANL
jgi:hypothetical protein